MAAFKTDVAQWPTKDDEERWLHSDIRDVAYLHTYKIFDKIVRDIANLNE